MELVDVFELIDTEEEAHDAVGVEQFAERVVGVERHVVQQRFREEDDLERRSGHGPPQRPMLHIPLGVEPLGRRVVLVLAALERFTPGGTAAQRRI